MKTNVEIESASLKTVLVGMSCELRMRSDVLRNDVINYVFVTGNGNCKFEFVIYSDRQNMADLEAVRGCPCKDKRQGSGLLGLSFEERSCEFELPTAGDVEWLLFSYT